MIVSETPITALAASDPLSQKVIGEAMYVHRILGPGFLETIYQNALLIRLKKAGLSAESGTSLSVHFEDEIIGNFQTDLIVESRLLLELKAVSVLTVAHEVQLVNYLTATKLNVGLLLNFGARSLEIKRRTRGYLETRDAGTSSSNPVNHLNPI
jgi:GxxExxY protein